MFFKEILNLKAFARSSQSKERADPSFRKYFCWDTHKDPKGTVKTQIVSGIPTTLPSESSKAYGRPMKKKKKKAFKTRLEQKVADEDFLLLQAFISECFDTKQPTSGITPKLNYQVISFMYLISM